MGTVDELPTLLDEIIPDVFLDEDALKLDAKRHRGEDCHYFNESVNGTVIIERTESSAVEIKQGAPFVSKDIQEELLRKRCLQSRTCHASSTVTTMHNIPELVHCRYR